MIKLVSDETFNGYDAWRDSEGVTLPGNQNATYNAGLSPLFTGRYGRWPIDDTDATDRRGWSAYLHSNTARDENRAYFLALNDTVVYPLQRGYTHRNNSLRCLVSTNNRIIMNLVSDDEATNQWNANGGISLPNKASATHNVGLSPLFYSRSGDTYVVITAQNVDKRPSTPFYYSANSTTKTSAYYFGAGDTGVHPSSTDPSRHGFPFRCLVSTNNRLMIKNLR